MNGTTAENAFVSLPGEGITLINRKGLQGIFENNVKEWWS